jgi:hypothetical protein
MLDLIENTPRDALIDWACRLDLYTKAADRPWYQANPPQDDISFYDIPCRCGRDLSIGTYVRVKRYICEDGRGRVFLGQCGRCQSMIWSYRLS